MKRVASSQFEKKMFGKIESERYKVNKRYDKLNTQISLNQEEGSIAGKYYWGDRDLFSCGSASSITRPESSFPLLPQLLLTPCLIADLLPLSEKEYESRYGLTFKQFLTLIEEGFIIPNIYYYYNNGWRQYEKYRRLWPILFHGDTRINCEWISAYLDRRFRFSYEKQLAKQFFEKEIRHISRSEEKRIIRAMNKTINSINQVPSVCGHQLAYLQTLGRTNPRMEYVTSRISELWKERGKRASAIQLLKAAQGLVVGPLTGAYGGKAHIPSYLYEECLQYAYDIIPIDEHTKYKDLLKNLKYSYQLREQAKFCISIANRLSNLKIKSLDLPEVSPSLRDAFPLSDDRFNVVVDILKHEVVRSAFLSRFSENLRRKIVDEKKVDMPGIKDYFEARKEIEFLIKPFPILPKFLHLLSDVSSGVAKALSFTPPDLDTVLLQVLLKAFSGLLKCKAEQLTSPEYVALFTSSRDRVLCKQWRKIRDSLKGRQ